MFRKGKRTKKEKNKKGSSEHQLRATFAETHSNSVHDPNDRELTKTSKNRGQRKQSRQHDDVNVDENDTSGVEIRNSSKSLRNSRRQAPSTKAKAPVRRQDVQPASNLPRQESTNLDTMKIESGQNDQMVEPEDHQHVELELRSSDQRRSGNNINTNGKSRNTRMVTMSRRFNSGVNAIQQQVQEIDPTEVKKCIYDNCGKTFFWLLGSYFCMIMSMLGIVISFVDLAGHFGNLNSNNSGEGEFDYLTTNLVDIATSTGAFATCLAIFQKLDFLKLAHVNTYGNYKWFALGWISTMLFFGVIINTTTYCVGRAEWVVSLISVFALFVACPIFAWIKFGGPCCAGQEDDASSIDDNAAQQQQPELERRKLGGTCGRCKRLIPSVPSCDLFEIWEFFVIFFAGLSYVVGAIVIMFAYFELVGFIFEEGDCRIRDANSTNNGNNSTPDAYSYVNDTFYSCTMENKDELDFNLNNLTDISCSDEFSNKDWLKLNDTNVSASIFSSIVTTTINDDESEFIVLDLFPEDYFRIVVTGCFVVASAFGKIADKKIYEKSWFFQCCFGLCISITLLYFVSILMQARFGLALFILITFIFVFCCGFGLKLCEDKYDHDVHSDANSQAARTTRANSHASHHSNQPVAAADQVRQVTDEIDIDEDVNDQVSVTSRHSGKSGRMRGSGRNVGTNEPDNRLSSGRGKRNAGAQRRGALAPGMFHNYNPKDHDSRSRASDESS